MRHDVGRRAAVRTVRGSPCGELGPVRGAQFTLTPLRSSRLRVYLSRMSCVRVPRGLFFSLAPRETAAAEDVSEVGLARRGVARPLVLVVAVGVSPLFHDRRGAAWPAREAELAAELLQRSPADSQSLRRERERKVEKRFEDVEGHNDGPTAPSGHRRCLGFSSRDDCQRRGSRSDVAALGEVSSARDGRLRRGSCRRGAKLHLGRAPGCSSSGLHHGGLQRDRGRRPGRRPRR
mmetsp:Transcript_6369/g.14827  ORF Transcript_6369/g.14827 Transcript_6369/m.14827 type:complete len:234 (+) Transcript_6369:956-1657(+)